MSELTEEELNKLDTEELIEVLESLEGINSLLDIVEDEIKCKENNQNGKNE